MSKADLLNLLTILAIVMSPLVAVQVTRWFDRRTETRRRKQEIYQALVRTRAVATNPAYVEALNLIVVEFYSDEVVLARWRELLDHLGQRIDPNAGPDAHERFFNERRHRQTRLLSAIARHLGVTIPDLELHEGGYLPQRWVDIESEQDRLRRYLIEMLEGRRHIPVQFVAGRLPPAYPPPPPAEDEPTV